MASLRCDPILMTCGWVLQHPKPAGLGFGLKLSQWWVVQSLTEPFSMGGNPVGIEGSPVTDNVSTHIVACTLAVLELADDIQLAQGGKGVLGGPPGHTGGSHHGGDAGDTK